MLEMNRN